jgi:antirestriction protein ArdC
VPYPGINNLTLCALAEQGFRAPLWMTFKQALGLNAHGRKGEKGSGIHAAETFDCHSRHHTALRPAPGAYNQAGPPKRRAFIY